MSSFDQRDIERFWSKVERGEGCWLWRSTLVRSGYGQFKAKGRKYRAHRVAYFLSRGAWPNNFACHICDVNACCRPDHLWDGTASENSQDRDRKGRHGIRDLCKYGHRLEPGNLLYGRKRRCMTCYREYQRRYREEHRGESRMRL